jgi:hypothetical protein
VTRALLDTSFFIAVERRDLQALERLSDLLEADDDSTAISAVTLTRIRTSRDCSATRSRCSARRNPSGTCCLGDVNKAVKEAKEALSRAHCGEGRAGVFATSHRRGLKVLRAQRAGPRGPLTYAGFGIHFLDGPQGSPRQTPFSSTRGQAACLDGGRTEDSSDVE